MEDKKESSSKRESPCNKESSSKRERPSEWEFKRSVKDSCPSHNSTKKKNVIGIDKDHNSTIKIKRKSNAITQLLQSELLTEDQSLKDIQKGKEAKQTPIKVLSPIEASLISPLSEFYYKTKNEGYIKVSVSGDICIKVKDTIYEIS